MLFIYLELNCLGSKIKVSMFESVSEDIMLTARVLKNCEIICSCWFVCITTIVEFYHCSGHTSC